MTKAELIERIARSRNLPPDITKKDIAAILGIAFEELSAYFAKAKVTRTTSPRFTFPRFGTFTKKKRPARRGVNPRTLEPMQIDASCTVDFKASKELRDQMNGAVAKSGKSGKSGKTAKTSRGSASGKASAAATTRRSTRTAARSGAKTTARTTAKTTAKTTARTTARTTAKTSTRTKASPATKVQGKTAALAADQTAGDVSAKAGASAAATAPNASTKRAAKATPRKRPTKVTAAKVAKVAPSGKRLTPRDEDAELDALIDDDSLFVELPATRLKRVRPESPGKPGSTETG